MSAFQSHSSGVLIVATNFIKIYQKCTVLKGNCVSTCFVKISAWREGQDLVNVLSKGQNFRELNSLGIINILPTKKKENKKKKGGRELRRNSPCCSFRKSLQLPWDWNPYEAVSLTHGPLCVSVLLNVSVKQYVTYNIWEQIKLTIQAAVKLDQPVCYSMAGHERNVELVSQIETSQIISRPVTTLHFCFLLAANWSQTGPDQVCYFISAWLWSDCASGNIRHGFASEDAGSRGNDLWVDPTICRMNSLWCLPLALDSTGQVYVKGAVM